MTMQLARVMLVIFATAAWPALAQQKGGSGEQRVALVIGNGQYKDSPLPNPVNDARAIAKALTALLPLAQNREAFLRIYEGDAGGEGLRPLVIKASEKIRRPDPA